MKKLFYHKVMRWAALACMVLLLHPTTWAQLDSIPISGTTIDTTKVYDGTTTANILTLGEYPPLPYSQVTISAEAHYLDALVGDNKPVVVTFSLSGDDAFRYQTPASIVLYADITPRKLTADAITFQNSREYDGSTNCIVLSGGDLQGILPGDTVEHTITANYATANVSYFTSVLVTHTIYGPQAGNYYVTDSNIYWASITRRNVTPEGFDIRFIKEYDGTDIAEVILQPRLDRPVAGDDISVFATAHYDNAEVGENKPITVHFELNGSDSGNYALTVIDSVLSINGQIALPIILDTLDGDQQIVSTAYGFCKGEQVTLHYHLRQGEPAYYRILFSDNETAIGFDTNWVVIDANDSLITFPVPNGCPAKPYQVTIEFQSAAGISSFYPISFRINLPNEYLVMPFDDVISIDNSGRLDGQPNRFSTFQWYHNGESIPNATKPYYQERNGFDGKYAVMVNLGSDDEAMVCPTTILADKTTISLMPSPVVATTTVKLQGFKAGQHQLQVFNSYGAVVRTTSFEGSQHLLDLSALQTGTYLITVDGHSTKTIKL